MIKALAMLSGGLDSILATRLILEEGIEIEAVNFLTVFCTCTRGGATCLASKSAADKLGIKVKVFEVSDEYFEVIKKPRYGYGSNLNPCLDCRIFMFKKARQYMKESCASFIITGEVLGERPMSQRRDAMRIIERDCELEGLILRPLSAKLLEPTIPEKEGWVDRNKLLDIKGRSRKPQMELASSFGINDYPCPAGGCLLTDPGFANRMRDLLKYKPDFTINDVRLLKAGRHFRLAPEAKLIVGRDKEENKILLNLAKDGDICLYPSHTKGPVGIGRGIFDRGLLMTMASIIARYSDNDTLEERLKIVYKKLPDIRTDSIVTIPIKEEVLENLRL